MKNAHGIHPLIPTDYQIGSERLDSESSVALRCSVPTEVFLVSCRVTASATVCMVWMEECASWACCLQLEGGGPSVSDSHSTVTDMKDLRDRVSLHREHLSG